MTKTKHVLVVEDDAYIRSMFTEVLESEGYLVHSAENGAVALDLLKELPSQKHPCVIVLDWMMPIMNGENFLRKIESDHATEFGKIPVILCSGHDNISSIGLSGQVAKKLKKPVQLDDFLDSISAFCCV